MFSVVKRVTTKLNRHLGMSIGQTYLYRLSKADGWSPAAHDGHLNWELLSPAHVGQLAEIGWFDEAEGLDRLRRGDRCYTVSIDGRLAHYSWVQRSGNHPITEAGMSVPVGNGAFWIYHCHTAKWARGRGIYPSTLERIVRDCFSEGDCTAWIYTSKQNIASQKGILRAGFSLVTTLRALRMGSQCFPLRGHNDPLTGLDHPGSALPDRRRATHPAFESSPTTVDPRQGPSRWDRAPVPPDRVRPRETASRSEF